MKTSIATFYTDLQASGAAPRSQAMSGRSSRGSRPTGKTRGPSSASRCAAAARTARRLQRGKKKKKVLQVSTTSVLHGKLASASPVCLPGSRELEQ